MAAAVAASRSVAKVRKRSSSTHATIASATCSGVAAVFGSSGKGASFPGLSVLNSLSVVPGTSRCACTPVSASST